MNASYSLKASYILACFRTGVPYMLEIHHDGRPVGYVTGYVSIVFDIIQLASLLKAQIRLHPDNPTEMNGAIRGYATAFKVEVVES